MKVLSLANLNLNLPYEQLYYVGQWSAKRKVAIVGTRSATLEYCKFTFNLAKQLALAGLNIVSGFAYGIDIYAHLGCLHSRVPESITAILAVPLDKISPKEHTKYVKDILQLHGFIGTVNRGDKEVYRNDFVLRNSVIAAISELVVFVQGSVKSGAMHTVRFALEYGREVAVVPGAPWDERSEGTNSLIKEGCQCVTCAQDVLDILGIKSASFKEPLFLSDFERAVYSYIQSSDKCFIEDIFQAFSIPYGQLEKVLRTLEEKNLVEIVFTGQVVVK